MRARFVGSKIAERLLADGHNVVVIDELSSDSREWVPEYALMGVSTQ